MKIKDYKCKCGRSDFFFSDLGNQKGIYCSYCGKWLKWADKDERNLAMKQEPCEDCISRQAVLNAMYELCDTGETLKENPWRDNPHMDAVVDALENLPSVTPQPKTGHWSRKTKVDTYDIEGVKTWGIKCQCDRCDFTTIVVEDFGYYKYCPNCGARMEVER